MSRTRLTKLEFFRNALVIGVSVLFMTASPAFAQALAPNAVQLAQVPAPVNAQGTALPSTEVATAERVFVTGSAIPTANEVGPNPVINVTRDLINKTGDRTTEEILRNLPIANANGVPISNNENGSNTAVGAATIALRGFDARATLILLDGRRVAPYPTGNRRVVFVDLNTIPQSSIESIEILKDGASTTYGADAVAGVVNIHRYKDYHGTQATIQYGNTTDKDSGEFNASLLFGTGDGNTNVSGTINYYHRNSIFNHDRDYSAVPPFLSSNASPYNLQVTERRSGGSWRHGHFPAEWEPVRQRAQRHKWVGSGQHLSLRGRSARGRAPMALTLMSSPSRFRRPSATADTSRWITKSTVTP